MRSINNIELENNIMKSLTTKKHVNYEDISNLRELNVKIKKHGMTGFRPSEVLEKIQNYKPEIEFDVLLEDHELDGAQIIVINCGKMMTFEYVAEDIVLRKIQNTNETTEPGVSWTSYQSFERERRFNDLTATMTKHSHTPDVVGELRLAA